MAKALGKNIKLSVYDGVSAYDLIGHGRNHSLTVDNQPINVTDASSAGWDEIEQGVHANATIALSGIATDDAELDTIRALAMSVSESKELFELENGTGNKFAGSFAVTNFQEGGPYDGEGEFSCTLVSNGPVTFGAV